MNWTAATIGTLGALAITSAIESVSPVTVGMEAKAVSLQPGVFQAQVTGRKIRDCQFVPGSTVGWYHDGGVWHETRFAFVDDPTPDSTRPNGFFVQSFGVWEWQDLPQSADYVRLTLQHQCGDSVTITMVGPFELKGPEA